MTSTDPQTYRMSERATCRICDSDDLVTYLDLGAQPPSNAFIRPEDIAAEARFPLEVQLCRSCGLSQLRHIVWSEDIFDEYAYLSSTSKALRDHYQGLVDDALTAFAPAPGALVVDVGCNDGIMLNRYPAGRFRLLGIEPSSAGQLARQAGFEVIDKFFNADLGAALAQSHGAAALITTTNVFAHVDDIQGFAIGARELLAPDGVWIIEFPYLIDMIDRCLFDTIYHEHLSYLALGPLDRLFGEIGLRVFKVQRTEVGASGPTLRLFVCRASADRADENSAHALRAEEAAWGLLGTDRYRAFAARVAEIGAGIRQILGELRARGERIGGFGAPAKGNTLLNYVGLTARDIAMIAENNALKTGKITPGSHIPIVDDATFLNSGIRYALLLTWNYLDFFLANAAFIRQGGHFIVPVPEPRILPAP